MVKWHGASFNTSERFLSVQNLLCLGGIPGQRDTETHFSVSILKVKNKLAIEKKGDISKRQKEAESF